LTAKIAEYFPNSAKTYNNRAKIIRQSKLNEYIIIDNKVDDDYRSQVKLTLSPLGVLNRGMPLHIPPKPVKPL
jgi:hypothetical protein